MFADERRQYVVDVLMVAGRISGDPFEGVDAAEPGIEFAGAQLVDGLRVPVGELPLACGVEGLRGLLQALCGEQAGEGQ
ncbi:hypothetical protein E1267_15730 [Nonomuraea longispora]|uniref:Uncharacterized protein n=1 Tax=Nonomuraea longispora TaxID=1848320 RepID=A0A4R4NC65_9ACTN|nr:hypothetical protein [Nonomuraea longispora]TDC06651.1 hypothetical protein E1267_15730 [Nonomuraea longispora]